MTYSVRDTAYRYDVENIINLFGLEKVKEGGDLALFTEEGQLCLRGGGVDFSAPLFCSKDELKRRLYRALSEIYGEPSDWGILVGVRPVKLAAQLLEQGADDPARILVEQYLLSEKKASLLLDIAAYERSRLGEGEAGERGEAGGIEPYRNDVKCRNEACERREARESDRRPGADAEHPLRQGSDRVLRGRRASVNPEGGQSSHTQEPAHRPVSLYLSVPFCPTKCRYCSFPMQPLSTKKKLLPQYVEKLKIELEKTLEMLRKKNRRVDCIYFGGGTPSTLPPEAIVEIREILGRTVNFSELKEFTFEAGRTDTVSEELMTLLRSIGADRVSVNPQTFSEAALRHAGRLREAGEFEHAFACAREAGLKINSDLILGLPMEDEDSYLRGLAHLIELRPENITVHALALKRGSPLFGDVVLQGDRSLLGKRRMYQRMSEEGDRLLREAGYAPYYLYRQKRMIANLENVGYTLRREDMQTACLYNSRIMSERFDIVAVGTGGVTKICFPHENRHEQLAGTRSVEEYIDRFDKVLARVEKTAALMTEDAAGSGDEAWEMPIRELPRMEEKADECGNNDRSRGRV